MFGFYRIAAAVPKVRVANVDYNVEQMVDLWKIAAEQNASVVLFPELGISSYSCGDLFYQERLHDAVKEGLERLLEVSKHSITAAIVGLPLWHRGRLYNCAAVLQEGRILGIVPKSYVPEHKEYYEKRWFSTGREIVGESVRLLDEDVPFGTDLLFERDGEFVFGIEICEDLWSVVPPSSYQALAGATLLFNLSASDEIVGKSDYREALVAQQSARCMAAYVYASCGVGESTTDVVFGGDVMIAENGAMLERGERFLDESQVIFADVDLQRLKTMRIAEGSFADGEIKPFRRVRLYDLPRIVQLNRYVDPHPFVPSKKGERAKRCREIFAIQAAALQKRLDHIGASVSVLGISGGLDSTLALLATYHTYEIMQRDPKDIVAVTMPGFGTTGRTLENAKKLCEGLGVTFRHIDIADICMAHFRKIGHDPSDHSVVFENVQARERTQILMDLANKLGGIVIGTGDMSESALGWSTYNGDHMSMYAINTGIPKTLIRYLVEWTTEIYPDISDVLHDILATPVSPELLPPEDNEIAQKTEEVVGPYELHDFFLYHMIKSGAEPKKILFLAKTAFKFRYDEATLKKWLKLFLRRFFSQQFKRSCMPDGPKVGTIALSPRGDWRMPSDAEVEEWIKDLEESR
ncbi:NAD(+) synthase [Hydrogenimonas cancrithermarum]|uniref:Glutamine-dependent NAD(+) synthetase n=1 Tax=Hydrogenimonas cancrithermarum TaxID=2993563 RepID=A0ABM8FN00_9BACT|nr:NAD(+) synthase [Hydrogenimonas cancrithermarum]BDY13751.1 NAD(+) synthase [Hydrogenimonas cancrithermarum]